MNKPNRLLICIILSSAVMMGSLMQVRADVVFQDNFGNGNLNNWTLSGSPSIVTSPVVAGSKYAAHFSSTSTDSFTFSYIQASFPQSNMATLEFYFQTDTTPPHVSAIGVAQIMTTINGESGGLLSLSLDCVTNGSLGWTFIYPSGENMPTAVKQLLTIYKVNSYNQQYKLAYGTKLTFP